VRRAIALALLTAACSRPLPEPESRGAQILARCGLTCHGAHQPGSMTVAMWDQQLWRMQNLYRQRGIPWLTPDDDRTLREYLARHAGTQ
jgi:hypothetical protein